MPSNLTHEYLCGGIWIDRSVRARGGHAAVDEALKHAPQRMDTKLAKREILSHFEKLDRDS